MSAFASEGWVGGEIVLIIVDRPLGLGGKTKQARLPSVDLFPQPAFRKRQRSLALALGLRLDKVGETFGFREIDAAVPERAAGELAGLCRPHTLTRTAPDEQS